MIAGPDRSGDTGGPAGAVTGAVSGSSSGISSSVAFRIEMGGVSIHGAGQGSAKSPWRFQVPSRRRQSRNVGSTTSTLRTSRTPWSSFRGLISNVQPGYFQDVKARPVDLLAQLEVTEHDLAREQAGPYSPRIEDRTREIANCLFPDQTRGALAVGDVRIRAPKSTGQGRHAQDRPPEHDFHHASADAHASGSPSWSWPGQFFPNPGIATESRGSYAKATQPSTTMRGTPLLAYNPNSEKNGRPCKSRVREAIPIERHQSDECGERDR